MELKNHKLQEQFAHHKEVVGQTPADPALQTLFNGICIHINGLTTPSHQVGGLQHSPALCIPSLTGAQAHHGAVWRAL